MIKRLLAVVAAVAVLAAGGVWLTVRDEVAKLRTMAGAARPPAPLVSSAVVVAEDLDATGQGTAAPLSYRLSSLVCPRGPMWRWHLENALVGMVISRIFTPEEQLATYLSEVYLGKVDGRQVRGVEAAAAAYFGKPAAELRLEDAAMLAAMVRSPKDSPLTDPARALARRNGVLRRMRARRAITTAEYMRAVVAPLPVSR